METLVKNSKAVLLGATSELAQAEKNDCVVRALAIATGSEYDVAHKFAADHLGRENRRGVIGVTVFMKTVEKNNTELNGKTFEKMGQTSYTFKGERIRYSEKELMHNVKGYSKLRKMIVATFLSKNPVGTFLMLVPKHAFVIQDGVVIDNIEYTTEKLTGYKGMRRPILAAYVVK
jgi:hypothetical protein